MGYVQHALRDDWEGVTRESFDCTQCGLCAIRCPADIVQHHVAQLARRAYARHCAEPSPQLQTRVAEIAKRLHAPELDQLVAMQTDELRELYAAREIEKAEA